MPLYEIGYGTYEESDYQQYTHWRRFSQKQLEKIVMECMAIAIQSRLEDKDENICQMSYQDIMFGYRSESVFEKELRKRGFKTTNPKIRASVSLFGWEHPLNPSWYKQEEPKDKDSFGKEILRYINENVDRSKAICHSPYNYENYRGDCLRCSHTTQKVLKNHIKDTMYYYGRSLINTYFKGIFKSWNGDFLDPKNKFKNINKMKAIFNDIEMSEYYAKKVIK